MFLIVPNYVRDAINSNLDKALADCPEASVDREHFYRHLLEHYNQHGEVPEISITKNKPEQRTDLE